MSCTITVLLLVSLWFHSIAIGVFYERLFTKWKVSVACIKKRYCKPRCICDIFNQNCLVVKVRWAQHNAAYVFYVLAKNGMCCLKNLA